VSLILFIIYLSGIFEVIKAKVPIKALSFIDNINLLISGNLILKMDTPGTKLTAEERGVITRFYIIK
jgi:hypothetical protein